MAGGGGHRGREWPVVLGSCPHQEGLFRTAQPTDVGRGCSRNCREESGLVTPRVSGRNTASEGAGPAEACGDAETTGASATTAGGGGLSLQQGGCLWLEHTARTLRRSRTVVHSGSACRRGLKSVSTDPPLNSGRTS